MINCVGYCLYFFLSICLWDSMFYYVYYHMNSFVISVCVDVTVYLYRAVSEIQDSESSAN